MKKNSLFLASVFLGALWTSPLGLLAAAEQSAESPAPDAAYLKFQGDAAEGSTVTPVPGGGGSAISYPLLLPTSRWYFLKELDRNIRRFFAFGTLKKAEVELKVTDEKAAELKAVSEKSEAGAEAIKRAAENFEKAQERLKERFEKLKETSENPNVEKLLEKVIERTAQHSAVLDEVAQKQKIIPDDDFKHTIESIQDKVRDTVSAAAERDKDVVGKTEEQIARAEKAIQELEHALAQSVSSERCPVKLDIGCPREYSPVCKEGKWICSPQFPSPAPNALREPIMTKKPNPSISPVSGDEPGTLGGGGAPREYSGQTGRMMPPVPQSSKDHRSTAHRHLEEAKKHLERAKAAYKEGKYGEAFGQANSAMMLAQNGLKILGNMVPVAERPVKPYVEKPTPSSRPSISKEPLVCVEIYKPVCGADGKTYSNSCFANIAGIKIAYEGACKSAETPKCQIQCIRYDPVCGADGKTYACGMAEAECNGVKVVYAGECRQTVSPAPTKEVCICTQEYAPVCGANGKTYGNACTAKCSGVGVLYAGECRTAGTTNLIEKTSPTPTPTPKPASTDTSEILDVSR